MFPDLFLTRQLFFLVPETVGLQKVPHWTRLGAFGGSDVNYMSAASVNLLNERDPINLM
jgi:hypothetical protein